jgi:probable O-glycosylation ligase (exosortase A-associated)
MGLFLWLKSRNKIATAILMAATVALIAAVMPQSWYNRMATIETYQQDQSAQGRINAWHFAFNLAKAHPLTGGGFECFKRDLFAIYAPEPGNVHDAHSIYFEVLGEQGFVGLALFLALGLSAWGTGSWVIRQARGSPATKWAADIAAMTQVSLVGYAMAGAFLGLSNFDLYYHLLAVIVLSKIILLKGQTEQRAPATAAAGTGGPAWNSALKAGVPGTIVPASSPPRSSRRNM